MNRSTVWRRAIAATVLAAASLVLAAVPAAAQDEAGAITGLVWFDRDGDKIRDAGEPGRASAAVEVRQHGVLVESHSTDSAGEYTITGLAPGDYTLRNGAYHGYTPTTPESVDLTVTGAGEEVNFGIKGGRLVGNVWRDDNGDGVRQAVDPAMRMGGGEVRLDGAMFGAATATIDADGEFVFEDLPNLDTYTLHAPDRITSGDEFTKGGKDSVVDQQTGVSTLLAIKDNGQLDVGVGYRTRGTDMRVDHLNVPAATVGEEFTVTARITNRSSLSDFFSVRVGLPHGVRVTGMTGLTRTPSEDPRLVNGTSTISLMPGGEQAVSFTMVADEPVYALLAISVAPVDLPDWNTEDNRQETKMMAEAANGAANPPAVRPVVDRLAPAAHAPAKDPVRPENLASTGASPLIPVILASVLLASGGALVFVLRRRVSRG
jgi:hypothetical protein